MITAYDLPAGSTKIQYFAYDPEGNLLEETNRIGLTLAYTNTSRNQVKTVARNIGGGKTFDYDANGNLTSETDWKGIATTHEYNALNHHTRTTNRLGHSTIMAYDLMGNITSVSDYEGNETTFTYDELNRVTDTWQPALEGQEPGHLLYTYYDEADADTNLKTETDAEGSTTSYEYNGRYRRTKQINALDDEYRWEYDDSGNLEREIDEEGKYTRHEYDRQNRLRTSYQSFEGREIKTGFQYDDNGNRTHVTDARNTTTETRYDKWNRAHTVIDPDNYQTLTVYDGEGNVVELTDGNGHVRSWQRDQRGLVLAATDAEEQTTGVSYDLNGNVETITDPRGVVTFTTYDAEDRLKATTEAYGTARARTAEVLARDKMGQPTAQKDYNGNVTATAYNALNLVEKVTDPFSNYTETTYYRTGKVKTVTNRRGYTTSYEYDELNREVLQTDAKNQTIVTTYDKVGNVKTVTDKRNIVTENFYDDLYRLVQTVRAGLRLVSNEYDDVGNLRFTTDANNNRVERTYNDRNLLDTTIFPDSDNNHPAGFTEVRTYDGAGNLKTLTNEAEQVTTYDYDRENRQIYVEFAGEVTTRLYDAVGNLTSVTQPGGNCRIMAYDEFDRLITVVDDPTAPIGTMTALDPRCTRSDGLNLVTRYEYDDNDNRTHQYGPGDVHVEYTYDALNRKTAHIQHKQGGSLVTRYTVYDENGNLEAMVDAKGQSFTYTYDELDRRTDENFPDSATPYLTITHIQSAYDANDNVIRITESKKTPDDTAVADVTINNYDDFDRLDDSTQRGLVIDYEYDDNGNRTLAATLAETTAYTFDSRNRLETAVVGADVTAYTYTPDGKQDTVTYPNGTDVKYTYYDTNRVESVTNKITATGALISSYTYEYSPNGNRTRQVEVQDGVSETTTYSYDAADRLIDFTVAGGLTAVTEYTYENYNRKTEKVTEDGIPVKSRSFNYDDANWLTSIEDDTDPANTFTIDYVYDNNGNTVLKSDSSLTNQDISYTYDSRNQLVQVIRGPPAGEALLGLYDYNAQGLRVRHRLSERGDVDYYYDDTAVIEEHDASDDSLLAHYRYADRLISLVTNSDTQYYHHDALGSTVNLTTAAGAVQVSYKLDPWGHIRSQNGASINRQIFTGQEHDENTGLIYFGARYYDPDIARFITQDTYLGQPGVPPSLHRYLYAYSNPMVYVDEEGESATVTGAVVGFFWGFGQMAGGMVSDLWHGEHRSTTEYLAVWGQNIYGGAMIGASIDIAVASGGLAATTVSSAVGSAGFEALTFGGKADESFGEFAENQVKAAAIGAVAGPIAAKVAPIIGNVVTKIPGSQTVKKGLEWTGRKVAEKAGALDSAVMSQLTKESLAKTGQGVRQAAGRVASKTAETSRNAINSVKQKLFRRGAAKTKPSLTTENVAGNRGTTVANVPKAAKPIARPATESADDFISFYHGTTKARAGSIRSKGIDILQSRNKLDFGKGFYTTTNRQQAKKWASRAADGGEVLEFKLLRSDFENLMQLNMGSKTRFSLGRFFRHNRLGGRLHNYDVVSGPMLGNPRQFLKGGKLKIFGQQTSFHTKTAIELLNKGLLK